MRNVLAPAEGGAGRTLWRWRFGQTCFDEASLVLTIGGQPVELERRPLELLALLLAHAGEVVTKDEILAALWADRDVSEASLTKCMARLRRVLGDTEHTTIHTVHGYGYRFAAAVSLEPSGQSHVGLAAAAKLEEGDPVPLRPNWRLVRRLGTGGYGDAWLIEQPKTAERRVAKFAADGVGLAGLRREITLGRLLREGLGPREDLVRILDWNLAEEPYFIETPWSKLGNLAEWAEAQGGAATVPMDVRLDLVAQIAEALAAAHAMGVLHKDLKPANVLMRVDKAGRPCVILTDFGSGRALDPSRLDALGITRLGADLTSQDSASGTQTYRAPELSSGSAPTVQADVFALGVMLFQLAAGDLRRALAPGWEEAIPDPLLREDIAAAAAGDPTRRLADAAELARRLRTLPARRAARAREAAAAAEAAATKRLLELARARRGPVLALLGALLVGFAATTGLYVRADRAQARAAAEAARASAVTGFLTEDLFSAANPLLGADPNIPVKKVLAAAAADIDRRFAPGSVDRAALQAAIGGAYAGLADSPRAVPLLRDALGTMQAAFGNDAPQTQAVRLDLVDLAERTADMKALRQAGRDLLATHPSAADTELRARFAVETADCLTSQNDSMCVAKLRPFLEEVRTRLGADSRLALRVQVLMAYQLGEGQHFDEAIKLARQTVQQTQALDGADSVATQDRRYYLGQILMEANQLPEAIATLTDVRQRLLDIFGTETEMSARAANQLGRAYTSGKDYEQALRMVQIGYDYNMKTHGEAFHLTRFAMHNLAKTLTAMGRAREAVPLAQRAFDQQRIAEGANNEDTLWIEATLADSLLQAGNPQQAESVARDTLAHAKQAFTHGEWDLGHFQYQLGTLLAQEGKKDEAKEMLTTSVTTLTKTLGPTDPNTQSAVAALRGVGG